MSFLCEQCGGLKRKHTKGDGNDCNCDGRSFAAPAGSGAAAREASLATKERNKSMKKKPNSKAGQPSPPVTLLARFDKIITRFNLFLESYLTPDTHCKKSESPLERSNLSQPPIQSEKKGNTVSQNGQALQQSRSIQEESRSFAEPPGMNQSVYDSEPEYGGKRTRSELEWQQKKNQPQDEAKPIENHDQASESESQSMIPLMPRMFFGFGPSLTLDSDDRKACKANGGGQRPPADNQKTL